MIEGTRFGDVIEGDTDANTFFGDAGDDRWAELAAATLYGGDGSDISMAAGLLGRSP